MQETVGAMKNVMPGEGMDVAKMPGHWILARLGKRVLRPGGMELTMQMLRALAIRPADAVVEFAPGMGRTGRQALKAQPASYTAVERDAAAAALVRRWLGGESETRRIIHGHAQDTGLPAQCATVVYGEAMLTMQPESRRRMIVAEAFRLLKPGGRYGVHELAARFDESSPEEAEQFRRKLVGAIHHEAHPLPMAKWKALLEEAGFRVEQTFVAPMLLLEPRVVKDEGLRGAAHFAFRLLTHRAERRRVLQMRKVFHELRPQLEAISLVARKPV